jgi:chromosome segregation ATPase
MNIDIMSTLFRDPLVMGGAAFVAGWLVAKMAAYLGDKTSGEDVIARERQIRGLEAEIRVTNKAVEKTDQELAELRVELQTASSAVESYETILETRSEEIEKYKLELRDECKKTDSLRNDLGGRAEETIRAEVQARDMRVELSLIQASSTAIYDEIDRLSAEREELTGRLRKLEIENPAGAGADSNSDDPVSDKLLSDC